MARNFRDVDNELYEHERPFYRACAGGAHFERTPEWDNRREELNREWGELCPYPTRARFPNQEPRVSFWTRFKGWLRRLVS